VSSNLKPLSTLAAVLLSVCLHGSPAAQTLDGTVAVDPTAGTATYTLTVTAPPGSQTWYFASPWILQPPIRLPFIQVGQLWLDPLLLVDVGFPAVSGPNGLAATRFVLPAPVTQGWPLCFQSVVLDPRGVLALSNWGSLYHNNSPNDNGRMDYIAKYDQAQGRMRFGVTNGAGSAGVIIKVNGGQKAEFAFNLQPDGSADVQIPVPGGLQRHDTVEVWYQGALLAWWSYAPPK
jgi:hypothetical protein